MNYDWTQSLFFAIIQKPMEKSYWLFVEGTGFMLTADPHTEWRHSSPTQLQTAMLTYDLNLECTASYHNFLFLGMKMLSYLDKSYLRHSSLFFLPKNKLLVCAIFSRWVDTI